MLPSIHILGLHLPMYSIMLGLGLALFFLIFTLRIRRIKASDPVTFNRILFVACLSIAALGVSAFLFNSLFHSIEHGHIVLGGITWLGGVVGAFAAVLILTHLLVPKRRGYAVDILDIAVAPMVLAHALGRVGCFLGGCCYGRVTDSALGVVFPEGSPAAKQYPNALGTGSLPVLPTQLIEAVFELVMFIILILMYKRFSKFVTAVWSVAYGIFRFVLEFFRGDDRGFIGLPLSPGQLLSVLLFIFGALLLLYRLDITLPSVRRKITEWQTAADEAPIVSLSGKSDADLLRELHSLYTEGIITEEEYERKRREILDRM